MSELNYIAHHGTKGMKWYTRLYQNKDGSLTPLGRVHYGVGEARKKAGEAVKSAPKKAGEVIKSTPKKVSSAVKKTTSDLKRDYREARAASKQRRAQAKKERAEARIQRRKERAERIALKLAERESKTTLRDIKEQYDESKLSAARKRVEALSLKQDRVRELADLKAQEKYLKSSMKKVERDAKRDAKKRYSRNDIKNLSDEELNARVKRLETEIKLASLEAQRNAPQMTAGAKWIKDSVGNGLSTGVNKLAGTMAVKVGKEVLGLSNEDINQFKSLTKK